jgi:hypothetical protein
MPQDRNAFKGQLHFLSARIDSFKLIRIWLDRPLPKRLDVQIPIERLPFSISIPYSAKYS